MLNKIVMQLPPSSANPRNSEGSFVKLADGRVLFVYTHYYGGCADESEAYLAGRYSDDGGFTWSKEDKVVVQKEGVQNVMSVSLLRLSSGKIALVYLVKNGIHDCRAKIRVSEDETKTWSEPISITEPAGYYVVNNDRIIQTKQGRLIVPSALHRNRGDADFEPSGLLIYYYSDDEGRTWKQSRSVYKSADSSFQEPGVVELADGRIYSFIRTDMGRQYESFSADGGEMWSIPKQTGLLSPCSPACVKRIPKTGELLIVWNDKEKRYGLPEPCAITDAISWGRTPLVCAVSADEAKTWRNFKVIEDSVTNGYCYTAIYFVDDRILLSYQSGGKDTGMVLDRNTVRMVDLEWVYGR